MEVPTDIHINRLISNYLLRVHDERRINTADYVTGNVVYYLLFKGNYNARYFDALEK